MAVIDGVMIARREMKKAVVVVVDVKDVFIIEKSCLLSNIFVAVAAGRSVPIGID